MKKAVSLIFTFLMLLAFVLSVNAEEFNGADLFTVDLPEDFEQTGTNLQILHLPMKKAIHLR